MPTQQEILEMERTKDPSQVLLFREGLFIKAYEGSAQQMHLRYGLKVSVRYSKMAGAEVASVGFPMRSMPTYAKGAVDCGERWVLAAEPLPALPLSEWKHRVAASPVPMSQREAEVVKAVRHFSLETSTPFECMQFLVRMKQKLI